MNGFQIFSCHYSEDGLCMDSMHAHGLCIRTVTVARYTQKIEEYQREKNASISS